MAFRTAISVAKAYENIKQQAANSKAYLVGRRAQMNANMPADQVLATIAHLGSAIAYLASMASTPGLAAYAQQQTNDPTYDVVAEYTAMRNAMVSARDDLINLFPKQAGTGFLLYQTLNADGSLTIRVFTPAQLATAASLLDAVIATIAD